MNVSKEEFRNIILHILKEEQIKKDREYMAYKKGKFYNMKDIRGQKILKKGRFKKIYGCN